MNERVIAFMRSIVVYSRISLHRIIMVAVPRSTRKLNDVKIEKECEVA